MGGIISYDHEGAVESAADLPDSVYNELREDVRQALYQEVPGFETIQTTADLERLCALAARDRTREPIRYQTLVDLFDVDRRTITDSYLAALEELYLLTPATEYDNQRPRGVQLYLRDPGLVTALTDGTARSVLEDFDREADTARVATYDHTIRFAYNMQAIGGTDIDPTVSYWRGRSGEVDFVFEPDCTAIPIGLVYRPSDEAVVDAVAELITTYETEIGLLLTGDTVRGADPISYNGETGIVKFPYWLYMLLC
jgi:predicted AAA+ superfamily ATPase